MKCQTLECWLNTDYLHLSAVASHQRSTVTFDHSENFGFSKGTVDDPVWKLLVPNAIVTW